MGVDLVTFTGSVATGSRIMQTAGRNSTACTSSRKTHAVYIQGR